MLEDQFKSESDDIQRSQNEMRRLLYEYLREHLPEVTPMEFLEEYKKFLLNQKYYLGVYGYRIRSLDEKIRRASNAISLEQQSFAVMHLINSQIAALREEIKAKAREREINRPRKNSRKEQ